MCWHTLSEIEKPDSGTEPIHQEHMMCSRFRGSCPSDVKSAGHPESGFSISLSVCSAQALCAPRETPKTPAGGGTPGYGPGPQILSGWPAHPQGRAARFLRIRGFLEALIRGGCFEGSDYWELFGKGEFGFISRLRSAFFVRRKPGRPSGRRLLPGSYRRRDIFSPGISCFRLLRSGVDRDRRSG